jgi:hypothetical protein
MLASYGKSVFTSMINSTVAFKVRCNFKLVGADTYLRNQIILLISLLYKTCEGPHTYQQNGKLTLFLQEEAPLCSRRLVGLVWTMLQAAVAVILLGVTLDLERLAGSAEHPPQ